MKNKVNFKVENIQGAKKYINDESKNYYNQFRDDPTHVIWTQA